MNAGTLPASPSITRFYLAARPERGAGAGAGDRLLAGAVAVGGLAAGRTASRTTTVSVPLTTPAGSYYLLACADDLARVIERHEGNNCNTSAAAVTIRPVGE